MSDLLVNHALKHVWAEPVQDHQHRIKPNRISPNLGFYKEAVVMWEKIPLPNYSDVLDTRSFHVYPLGGLPPFMFALEMQKQKWYRADELSGKYNTVIDVYADNGAIVPRNHYYLYHNYDDNFILAVARNTVYLGDDTIVTPHGETLLTDYTLDKFGITIRFYNNALTHNEKWLNEATDPVDILTDYHRFIRNVADFNTFKDKVSLINQNYNGQGKGLFYMDGFLVSEPSGYKDEYEGCQLSYIFDETIKDVRFFDIIDVPGFRSILDPRTDKYLLVSEENDQLLEYKDDCDFYVVLKHMDGSYRGVLIDVYNQTPVRQITHNAWSLSQDSVNYVSMQHDFLSNLNHNTLVVVVRNGGMVHDIGLQNNRIEDLYHLPYPLILEAMSGVNSSVKEWQAPELEKSAYMRLVSAKLQDISSDLVEEAYGYNAMTRAIARASVAVVDGKITIDAGLSIPWDVYNPNGGYKEGRRTIFWYDDKGLLLGYTANNTTARTLLVPPAYASAKKAEIILGTYTAGVGEVGTFTDMETIPDPSYGYFGHRNYVCPIVGGAPTNNWVDVTGGPYASYIRPADGSTPYVKWNYSLLNAAGLYPATRFANTVNVHAPIFRSTTFSGVFAYDISRISNGRLSPLQVPPGKVDVFMDGELLIMDLDYYYISPGSVVVVRKPKKAVDSVRIIIRFYGYMNPLTRAPFKPRDVGFIKNGKLSVNQVYNTWHDRDIRINVAGGLKFVHEVEFAEAGSPVTNNHHLDGRPYSIEDYQTLVEPFSNKVTVNSVMQSMEIDKRVGEYLTSRLPETEPVDQYISPYRHELYSPIMATFIQLMIRGFITDSVINLEATDSSILASFGYISGVYGSYDPAVIGFDKDYCYVHPHPFINPVQVTSKQYAFLERVNRIFLKGVVDLTNSVTIKAGT